MRKLMKRVAICFLIAAFGWGCTLLTDREQLNEELIRLHVVANSDSEEDQNIKLRVRDAVVSSLQSDLENVADVAAAKAYLQENLPKIQKIRQYIQELNPDCRLEVDGGVDRGTAAVCKENGADVLVSGSAYFRDGDKPGYIRLIQE